METRASKTFRPVDKTVPVLCMLVAISIGGFLKTDVRADAGGGG